MSCASRCVLLVGALLAAGSGGAQAVEPSLQPSIDRSELLAPERVPSLPAPEPEVTGYEPSECVTPGDELIIKGSAFGERSGKRVALGGHGIHVDLPVLAWSEDRIRVRIPEEARLEPGRRYYAALEGGDHGEWLSNLRREVEICPARPTAEAPPEETGGGGGFAAGGDRGRKREAAEPSARKAPSPRADPRRYRPSAGGSLLDRKLPPPPAVADRDERAEPRAYEPGEVLAVNTDMAAAQGLAERARAMGFALKRRYVMRGLGLVVTTLRTPDDVDVPRALARLRKALPDVWLDANHRYRLQDSAQKSGASTPRRYGRGLIDWPADAGCGRGVRVGMIDTAVAREHPGLRAARIESRSFLSRGVPAAPAAHGTAVAGLLVGQPHDEAFTGLLPKAGLLVAEVVRAPDEGADEGNLDTTAELLARGMSWLVEAGVHVINVSLGGPDNLILRAAVGRVHEQGVAVTAAAGNSGPDGAPVYPAAYPQTLAVTAVDARRGIYRAANRGEYIDLAAPGVDVWVAQGDAGRYASGTSYATPYVTATAALALAQSGSLDAARRRLRTRVVDLGEPGRDRVYGWGLAQAPGECPGG